MGDKTLPIERNGLGSSQPLAELAQDLKKATEHIGGVKFDAEKPRTDLIPIGPILEVAKVLTHGAEKYGDRDWENGFDWSRAYGAALRHVFAWWNGEDFDPESNLHHLAHALCELMFALEFVQRKTGRDNRPCLSVMSSTETKMEQEKRL